MSFCWGVSQLFTTLNLYNGDENGEWSFGQVMSVALLAIPLVTMIELLYSGTQPFLLKKQVKANRKQTKTINRTETQAPTAALCRLMDLPAR